MSEEQFWQELRSEYNELRNSVAGFTLPLTSDIELFYVSKILPDISSSLHQRINYGYSLYPYKEDSFYIPLLVKALQAVGNVVPQEYTQDIPPFMKVGRQKPAYLIVEESIESRSISVEFMRAWAEFNQGCATIIALFMYDEPAHEYFKKYIESGTPPKLIERQIYCNWMYPRWVTGGGNKGEIQQDLAEAISKELASEKAQTRLGSLLPILTGMIKVDNSGLPLLTGRYMLMTKKEIKALFVKPIVPAIELPDLV